MLCMPQPPKHGHRAREVEKHPLPLVVVRLMACRLSQICSSAHLVVTAFGFAKRWRDP
jgi:hypothetical protein